MAARKNKPPFATLAALAALVVIGFTLTEESAATTIAPAKDRMTQVIIGGKTLAVEFIPVFATTEWTHINNGTTTTMRIAQTIPITTKQVIDDGKTTTLKIQNNRRSEVSFGTKTITVEIADNYESRIKGLSARHTLSGGMLFVYDKPKEICLWMKDTYISLEALFLYEDGKIINTSQMKPHTTNPHCSTTKAKYALELPAQWRQKNQVQNETKVTLPKNLYNDSDD